MDSFVRWLISAALVYISSGFMIDCLLMITGLDSKIDGLKHGWPIAWALLIVIAIAGGSLIYRGAY